MAAGFYIAPARRRDDYWENRMRRRSPGTITKIETPDGEELVTRNSKGDNVARSGEEGDDPIALAVSQLARDNALPPTVPITVRRPDGLPPSNENTSFVREPFQPLSGKTAQTPYGTLSSRPQTEEERLAREWTENVTRPASEGTINGYIPSKYPHLEKPTVEEVQPYTIRDYLAQTGRKSLASNMTDEEVAATQPKPAATAATPAAPATPATAATPAKTVSQLQDEVEFLSRAFQNPDAINPLTGSRMGDDPAYKQWEGKENSVRASNGLGPVRDSFQDFRDDKDEEVRVAEYQAGLLRKFSQESRDARTETAAGRRGQAPRERVTSTVRRSPAFMEALNDKTRQAALRLDRIQRGETGEEDLLLSNVQDLHNAAQGGAFTAKNSQQITENQKIEDNKRKLADDTRIRMDQESLGEALSKARTPLEIEEAIRNHGPAVSNVQGEAMIAPYLAELKKQDPAAMQHARDLRKQGEDPGKAMDRGKYYAEYKGRLDELRKAGGYDEKYLVENGVQDANGRIVDGTKLEGLIQRQQTITNLVDSLQNRLKSSQIGEEEETRTIDRINELQENRFKAAVSSITLPDDSPIMNAPDGPITTRDGKNYIKKGKTLTPAP